MNFKILSLLTLVLLSSESFAQAGPKSFTCRARDFASTEITFVERGESLTLIAFSRAMQNVVKGVTLPPGAEQWRMMQVAAHIPMKDCRFSATDKYMFSCATQNLAARAVEIPDGPEPAYPETLETKLAWASFSIDKVTTETVTGEVWTQYLLRSQGYGDQGDFAIAEYDCGPRE